MSWAREPLRAPGVRRRLPGPGAVRHATALHPLLRIQRLAGNRATEGLVRSGFQISERGDPFEREAQRVAERLTRTPTASAGATPTGDHEGHSGALPLPSTEGKTHAPAGGAPAPDLVPGPGRPLPLRLRTFFESRLGHSLRHVRLHTGPAAASAAGAVNALAFTVGSDVVFDADQFRPASAPGLRLLAHELVHVIQQTAPPLPASATAPPPRLRSPLLLARQRRNPQRPPADPEAFRGIEAYFMRPPLPLGYSDTAYVIRLPDYVLGPNMRRQPHGPDTLLYYIATRLDPRRNEWVIGPDSVDRFVGEAEHFKRMGNITYMGGEPRPHHAATVRFLRAAMAGRPREAASAWGESWSEAVRDPVWLTEAVLSTASAGARLPVRTPAPTPVPRPPPALRVIQGGRGAAPPPRVSSPPPAAEAPAALRTEGSAAVAAAPGRAAPATAPAQAPRHLQAVPAPASTPGTAGAGATGQTSIPVGPAVAAAVVHAPAPAPAPQSEAERRRRRCRDTPCEYPLPIRWPTQLPLPGAEWLARRRTEPGDRGREQRRFQQEIDRNRGRVPPPSPCDEGIVLDESRWNDPFDAHHILPLYLGGYDVRSNLCALESLFHQQGHPRLDNQTEYLDLYTACGICSGFLSRHPAGQVYEIIGFK